MTHSVSAVTGAVLIVVGIILVWRRAKISLPYRLGYVHNSLSCNFPLRSIAYGVATVDGGNPATRTRRASPAGIPTGTG